MKLPDDVRRFFAKKGSKGGKKTGQTKNRGAAHYAKLAALRATKNAKWIDAEKQKPEQNQKVIARYVGVYHSRLVTYYFDGVNHHFGNLEEGGSQPATHWKSV